MRVKGFAPALNRLAKDRVEVEPLGGPRTAIILASTAPMISSAEPAPDPDAACRSVAAPGICAAAESQREEADAAARAAARGALLAPPVVVWTSTNMGEGSGLDADALDGVSGEIISDAIDDEAASRAAADKAIDARVDALEDRTAAGAGTAAWAASRTGFVQGPTAGFTTIPGLAVTFTLPRPALVLASTTGSRRSTNVDGDASYAFRVDGARLGDESLGQRLVSTGPGLGDQWKSWSLSDSFPLAAGSHAIEVQTRISTVFVCGENDGRTVAYAECELQVIAVFS